jgi:hypothetical protein
VTRKSWLFQFEKFWIDIWWGEGFGLGFWAKYHAFLIDLLWLSVCIGKNDR